MTSGAVRRGRQLTVRPMRISRTKRRSGGFTYVGLLMVVAIFGAALASVGNVWSTTLQRERERELLFVGDAFRRAIAEYHDNSPGGGAKQFPRTLDDLLLDRRFPTVRRHLRKIYADPFSGKPEWGIIKGPGDTIMGIYSLSKVKPLKTSNFPEGYEVFEGKNSHSEWQFSFAQTVAGPSASNPVSTTPLPGRPGQGISTSSIIRPAADGGGVSTGSIPLQSVESLSQGGGSGTDPASGSAGDSNYYQRRDLPGAKSAP